VTRTFPFFENSLFFNQTRAKKQRGGSAAVEVDDPQTQVSIKQPTTRTMPTPRRAAVLNAMQRFSPEAPFKRGGDRGKGCRCGRTKCLKQYCACFRSDVRCTHDCVCNDCHNDGLHEDERMMAVRAIRLNSKEVRSLYRVLTTLPFTTACSLYRVLFTFPFTILFLP